MDNQNPLNQAKASNPLAQFYRRPGTYITLPSGGRFYRKSPKVSETGELAVYPMTAKDELILKNPDALYNGEAVKQVISSVCPDIENVNDIPAADIDAILVAMRMTSYGDDMPLEVRHGCEASEGKVQTLQVSLGSIIGTIRPIPTDLGVVTLSTGLTVYLRPYNLADQSLLLRTQFNSMRNLQALENNDKATTEQKTEAATASYNLLIDLSQQLLTGCVVKVVTPEKDEVTDRKFIVDWMKNLDRASVERLDQEVKKFQEYGIVREIDCKCDYCGETFKTDMLFDPTGFFTKI